MIEKILAWIAIGAAADRPSFNDGAHKVQAAHHEMKVSRDAMQEIARDPTTQALAQLAHTGDQYHHSRTHRK